MSLKFLFTEKAPAAIGPYSQGTQGGNVVFVSGQLPIVDGVLQKDVEKATLASLTNMLEIVKAAGGSLENIAKVNVFVDDMDDFAKINAVYTEFFGDHKPARALVEVSKLPKGAVIEIECIAVL